MSTVYYTINIILSIILAPFILWGRPITQKLIYCIAAPVITPLVMWGIYTDNLKFVLWLYLVIGIIVLALI